MIRQRGLAPGTRVRLVDHPIQMHLRSFTGVVVGPDIYDSFYVIRLDEPGIYHHADGRDEELEEVVEGIANLKVISASQNLGAAAAVR